MGQVLIAELVAAEPRFIHHLRKDVNHWLQDDGEISPCMLFSSLTNFVLEDIAADHCYNYRKIFALVENYVACGEEVLRNAASTCFIENLQNVSAKIDPELWVHYLGDESRKFAQSWDRFTGVKTQGLYDGPC